MKLIMGLGNPGEKYVSTRHNVGFTVLDHLLRDIQSAKNTVWEESPKLKSQISQVQWKSKDGPLAKVILAKPATYMNNSGMAVSSICSFYKIDAEDVWIVHDELDLPLGFMKIRLGGSGAGHHGVESIMEALGTDKFWRFRIGIGETKTHEKTARHKFKETSDFVLDKFNTHETRSVKHVVKRAVDAIEMALEKDLHSAMNRFNTK